MSVRVLIVDDSNPMRRLIARFLEAAGIPRPTEAETGEQAMELFAPGKFDLVLTDWHMPGMSGLDVLREIRSQDAKVPVIMMTTEAGDNQLRDAREAGVTDYLVKPFGVDTRQQLLKHCQKQREMELPDSE